MLINEKIKPQKSKTNKILFGIYSFPIIFISLVYALGPNYDMSDNPTHEDNFIMTKMANVNHLFNNNAKNIEQITCSNNQVNQRVCLLTIKSNNDKRPGEMLVVAGNLDDKNVDVINVEPSFKNIHPTSLKSSIQLGNTLVKLPDYTIDFIHQQIHVNNLDKTHYTPDEIYQAINQEQDDIIKPFRYNVNQSTSSDSVSTICPNGYAIVDKLCQLNPNDKKG